MLSSNIGIIDKGFDTYGLILIHAVREGPCVACVPQGRWVWFQCVADKIGPKWDKSMTFIQIRFHYILVGKQKSTEIRSEKAPDFPISGQYVQLWIQTRHPCRAQPVTGLSAEMFPPISPRMD